MGHHAFDYSIWEKEQVPPKQDKIKHSHRIELKQQEKKRRDYDDWEEWDD